MRFKVMFKSMKFLFVASVLSLAAVSAAQAGGRCCMQGEFHSGASAAPACDATGRTQKKAEDGQLGFVTLLGSVEPIAGECHFRQRCPRQRAKPRRLRCGTDASLQMR